MWNSLQRIIQVAEEGMINIWRVFYYEVPISPRVAGHTLLLIDISSCGTNSSIHSMMIREEWAQNYAIFEVVDGKKLWKE